MIIPGRIPVLKRLPVSIDHTDGIQRYDRDNKYPQRAKETMYRSYSLSGIIPKHAGFLNGEGFKDTSLNSLIVCPFFKQPLTAQSFLDKICQDKSWINGFAIHANFNANFTVSSFSNVPFEYCRLEALDDNDEEGEIVNIKYSTNWEQDYAKEQRSKTVVTYDRFNPDPEFLAQRFAEFGGAHNYKGQIFYWTPEENQYPKATFDSVFELAQAQYEISEFILRNIVNGFTAGQILFYPGKIQGDEEKEVFKRKFQDHKGPMGANSTLVVELENMPEGFNGSNFIVPTTIANNDKLFEFTQNQIEKSILQNYGMPYEIVGKTPDSGLFNKQQIEEAYTYYNAVTRDERNQISRALSYLFKHWWQPIESDFAIEPQKYNTENISNTSTALAALSPLVANKVLESMTEDEIRSLILLPSKNPTPAPVLDSNGNLVQPPQNNPQQQQIDSIIRSLSRRDVSKIYSYVNDFKNGRATIEQTRAFLKPFLQTDENVNLFIQDPEGDG